MPRPKKTTAADDFMELVAKLPWWAGVALAMLSYLLLHQVAARPMAVEVQPGRVSALVIQGCWRGLASVGQYILPILCLGAAVMSAWRRNERRGLVVADVAQSQASDALDGMSWREFEMLVGEGFRLQGYQVVETGGGGPDGGIDLVLTRPGKNGAEKFLVQCKQWRAFKVDMEVALSNAWLKAQGLVSLKEQWCKAQGYTTGRLRHASQLGCSAHCRPARWVVWGLGARHSWLPD